MPRTEAGPAKPGDQVLPFSRKPTRAHIVRVTLTDYAARALCGAQVTRLSAPSDLPLCARCANGGRVPRRETK